MTDLLPQLEGPNLEDIEYRLVLDTIHYRYGYNFHSYAKKSLKRRLLYLVNKLGYEKLTDMIKPILYDESFFEKLLDSISVPVTEMFRDPKFFKIIKQKIIPLLQTYPNIKIWHAGCATGEEVYSMAIMLEEEGVYDHCHIYATDFNTASLEKAKQGIYSYSQMKKYTENYYLAGGENSFSEYYDNHIQGTIKIDKQLARNITFAKHNLESDSVFGQFNLIICRNVLIYFDQQLQNKIFSLFFDSNADLGYLCLGSHESINNKPIKYDTIFDKYKIYRKQISKDNNSNTRWT